MENAPLKIGQPAPEFNLMNQDKTQIKLSDYRGKKKVILLFYPMDFSPVCTQEHCTFGPELGHFAKTDDTVVFGVSCERSSRASARRLASITSGSTQRSINAAAGPLPPPPYMSSKRDVASPPAG